ncbi:MAG: dihydrofolate reductase [Bacteroidaceae bacterium]|nr:dihydrofolate reductase [Bacteroidaceae bacterium]
MIQPFDTLQERFADLQLLRYEVPGFSLLSLRQKLLIYYLAEAALWGRDILWDQNCSQGIRVRKTLEAIYTHYDGPKEETDWKAFVVYLKRVWFANGIHHHYSCQKFEPGFSREFFLTEVSNLNAALLPLRKDETKEHFATELAKTIFNPRVMPKRVNQADGEDLLITSSCNYYAKGITQPEAEAFYANIKSKASPNRPPMFGMNSRLERDNDGKLYENVWQSGGLYGQAIDHICEMLCKARDYAENTQQKAVIDKLISFYQNGNLKTFDEYAILWVGETESEIDFTNGFTEVYGDPLGLKASWEGYVNVIDHEATRRAKTLSNNAQWFENHSPVDSRFKKKECRGVTAKVINAAMLGGDLYPSSAIGINLPNSNWIRAEYGSKSVTIANLTHAYNIVAKGSGMRQEFVIDDATIQLLDQYGDICDDLHTDLHECLGHGSGQLLPGVDGDALRAYGSTIEEARADLFGLYYIADSKLVELGLMPNDEAYKSQYYSYMMNGLLTQMVRIEEGCQIEEAHMRNRALISRWTLTNYPDAVQIIVKDNKHYVSISDYKLLRKAFGTLLAEVQRIKSEGDYEAAQTLVEQYGIKLDAKLHKEIRKRYQRLNLAPYKGFINPKYELIHDTAGNIIDVSISYNEAYDKQMLRYGKQYSTL